MQKIQKNQNIDGHVVFSFKHGKSLSFEVNRELKANHDDNCNENATKQMV